MDEPLFALAVVLSLVAFVGVGAMAVLWGINMWLRIRRHSELPVEELLDRLDLLSMRVELLASRVDQMERGIPEPRGAQVIRTGDEPIPKLVEP